MPEYRRFIAYFYEYINGKKQKSAGFAKVELRSGMWRLLFRITTQVMPQPPVRVYGFVRERGYLLGLPMGTMRFGNETAAEEWAYRANTPIAGKHSLEDLAGIWIQSGDGRRFLTVWDEEPIEVERLVLELPEEAKRETESTGQTGQEKLSAELAVSQEHTRELSDLRESDPVAVDQEIVWEEGPEREEWRKEDLREAEQPETEQRVAKRKTEVVQETMKEEIADARISDLRAADLQNVNEENQTVQDNDVWDMAGQPEKENGENSASCGADGKEYEDSSCSRDIMEEMLQKRQTFSPLPDAELTRCVMIKPCDIVRMQQEGYQVGRSSFLQHAFYQYRHLLLGLTADGAYMLGVPGVHNPQEKYMAELFGFKDFKLSRVCACRKTLGYWCRPLCRERA